MPELRDALQIAGEVLKIIGALASFYAVFKLRQIEKKYLFKATVPDLIVKIDKALGMLSAALPDPSRHRTEIAEALNYLMVDVKNLRRKCRGDSLSACTDLLRVIQATRPRRYFWQSERPMTLGKPVLVDIYGKGLGLIHSLGNDIQDDGWSGK
jgi:hypothetical protein